MFYLEEFRDYLQFERGVSPRGAQLCDELHEQFPAFDYEQLPARRDLWRIPAGATHGATMRAGVLPAGADT